MKQTRFLLALLLVIGGIGTPSAQTLSYADAIQQLAASCGADLSKHCKGVELGGGRIKACLDAKQAVISAQCKQARTRVYDSIARRVVAQRNIIRICAPDALTFCGGVVQGDANVLDCMMAVSPSAISSACNQAFNDTGWRTERVEQ